MTARIRLKRPTGCLERGIVWLGLLGILFCGLSLAAFGLFNSIHSTVLRPRDSMLELIVLVGIIVVIFIGIAAFYSARKRAIQEFMPGSMMAWLKSHLYLGLLALGLALIHALIASFNSEFSLGKITLFVFALLVFSGIVWRLIYVFVPPQVARQVGNLAVADTRSKSGIVQVEIDKLLAGKSNDFRWAADQRRTGRRAAQIDPMLKLAEAERSDWDRYKRLADRRDRYTRREWLQGFYAKFLQGWKWLHVPLAVLLAGLIVLHILDVFEITNVANGGVVQGLPPATACAKCHSQVAGEWRLAMHSRAQSGAIALAQINLALEKYPQFGLACNNCHAPVGTALTDTATLPLDTENNLRNHPNGAVVDDGVTCIVCHTLPAAPEERRGMAADFPVAQGNATSFADMFGPPLTNPNPLPNPWHNAGTGFMTDSVATSQLCGSCHNVKVDIDGDGEITAFPGSDSNGQDTDGDGQLDENELDVDENGKLQDLVLQTTFDEWEDYVAIQAAKGEPALGCVDCHMPKEADAPIVLTAPGSLFSPPPDRERRSHAFVGVDYDLTPGYYNSAGMPPDAFERVLAERAALLQSAAGLEITTSEVVDDTLTASVTVRSNLVGHGLPTGFAFARQMWLEVSAQTESGRPVCLTNIVVNGETITAQCTTGSIASPQADLLTCDPLAVAKLGIKPSKNDELVQLNPEAIAPLDNCDPWLTNFQKILTDGDPDGDGIFTEVPYQSLLADIVKTRVRVSDGQAMDAINLNILVKGEIRNQATFDYTFDVSQTNGEKVIIKAVMHFRHLPPYFVRALDGLYPDGLTSADLLTNLVVSDMAEAQLGPIEVP